MLKYIVVLITAFVCAQVLAEPMKMASKAELASAKKAAEGLLTSGVSADQVFEYAEEAKKSAEKYQLYCTAFKLYAKEEKAEEAAKVISTIQVKFIGAPDKDIVSMIEQYAKKLAKDNEELGAALSVSKARAFAASQLSKAKKELKKNPNSVEHKYLIAESYAILGDWKSALKQFKDAGGSVWQVASEEASGVISAKTAAFWWDYKPRSKFNAEPAFKAHSAALYEKLLKDGELSVLEKATAESRIEQAAELGPIEESAGKPKNDLAALKKICNTKGLIHCWRFNGNLKDCVGGKSAELKGTAKLTDKSVECDGAFGSYAMLGPENQAKILPIKGDVAIEIWATQRSLRNWSRIIAVGHPLRGRDYNALQIVWSRRTEINTAHSQITYADKTGLAECVLGAFDLNKEYHIAMVLEPEDGGCRITVYKQDGTTGQTLAKNSSYVKDWNLSKLNQEIAAIGHSNYKEDSDAHASYNEVRIWNRALSEEELTKNAIKFHKAGETMKK